MSDPVVISLIAALASMFGVAIAASMTVYSAMTNRRAAKDIEDVKQAALMFDRRAAEIKEAIATGRREGIASVHQPKE